MKNPYRKLAKRKPVPMRPEPAADVVFVVGGLKAAFHSQKTVRNNVMSDVSKVLNCDPGELDFLFGHDSHSGAELDVFDFPDSDRRRQVIRKNHLDAAE